MKVDIEAGPEYRQAFEKYTNGEGIPSISFVSSEGGVINKPRAGAQALFDVKQFVGLMEDAIKKEEEFQQLKAGLKETPDHPKMNAQLALIYLEWAMLEKAQPFVNKALKLDPKNETGLLPELYLNLGINYGNSVSDENDDVALQKSEGYFKKVIEEYADSKYYYPAHYYLGVIYTIQKKYKMATEMLNKAAESKDPDTKAQALLGLEQVNMLIHQR